MSFGRHGTIIAIVIAINLIVVLVEGSTVGLSVALRPRSATSETIAMPTTGIGVAIGIVSTAGISKVGGFISTIDLRGVTDGSLATTTVFGSYP